MKARLLIILFFVATASFAQTATPAKPAAPLLYGANITLEKAKAVAAAAAAYATKSQWTVVIAIVDTGGNLVYLEKFDNTQVGSIDVALAKAKTSNNFKRPSKGFQDALAGVATNPENARVLSLPNAIAVEGGELIVSEGKIIGAIGVSGMSAAQDTEVAKAGLAVIK